MKPLKLLMKLNPLGEPMKNLSEAFIKLKEQDHNKSFENLGDWLDKNNQTPKTMKSIYQIAASILIASLGLITCTVPVEHEEKIGYMIKGYTTNQLTNMKKTLADIPQIDMNQLSVHQVIHEKVDMETESLTEVIMILPEADRDAAEEKRALLGQAFNFKTLDILPIEETVTRTIMESALHQFEFVVSPKIPQEKIESRINAFLHENSSTQTEAQLKVDENGKKFVVMRLNLDKEKSVELKRNLDGFFHSLSDSTKFEVKARSKEEIIELKNRELKKQKMKQAQNK